MLNQSVQVVILVVCYNNRDEVAACLDSLAGTQASSITTEVVVVDNASSDGSADLVAERFPQVHLVRLERNTGFTGGNNVGIDYIRRHWPDTPFVMLLNADTVAQPGFLRPLVEHMQAHPNCAIAQSRLMLADEPQRINTAGNVSHYLGFGYMSGYRQLLGPPFDTPQPIDFASGAAMLIRMSDLSDDEPLFDPSFFMYLEDAELAWRMRSRGREVWYIPDSVIEHHYQPTAPRRAYEHLERNRWLLLLTHYRWRTMLLLGPALLLMELGQWTFALLYGCAGAKWRSYAYFLSSTARKALWQRRHLMHSRRLIGDRQLTAGFAGQIHFEAIDHPLWRWVGNPLFDAIWSVVRPLIRW